MFVNDFIYKFKLRNLIVKIAETEFEYKMFVNKLDMKSNYIKELDKKQKKNKKIMKELHFQKYRLARKLKQKDEDMEIDFKMKQISSGPVDGLNFLNTDEEMDPKDDLVDNQKITTIRPARPKNQKVSSKMRIFEDIDEGNKPGVENFLVKCSPVEVTENEEMKMAEIECVDDNQNEGIDDIFEEIANSMPTTNKENMVDKTLLDFDKSICVEKKIKTPFD